jgi:hypothetical protein
LRPEYVVGVDVGVSGAICRLDIHSLKADFFDMPTGKSRTSTGGIYRRVDEDRLRHLIRDLAGLDTVLYLVEYQQAFGKMSKASAFKLADCFGLLRGLIISTNKPLITVKPREWKRAFRLAKSDGMTQGEVKEMSRQMALELFPAARESLKRKLDHNRAEALLVAEFGRRHRLGSYIHNYRPIENCRPVYPKLTNPSSIEDSIIC